MVTIGRSCRTLLAAVVSGVLTLMLAGTASAAPTESAKSEFDRGCELFNDGKYGDALACFEKVIAIEPLFPKGYNMRGACQRALEDVDAALIDFEKALKLDPFYCEVYLNRAYLWILLGKPDRADSDLESVYAMRPEFRTSTFLQSRIGRFRAKAASLRHKLPGGPSQASSLPAPANTVPTSSSVVAASTGTPLDSADPAFRITYFVLEGQAIDYLLDGKVSPDWERRLAGQPFIVANDVYRVISDLAKRYRRDLSGMDGLTVASAGKPNYEASAAAEQLGNRIRSSFVGADGVSDDYHGMPCNRVSVQFLESLRGTAEQWHARAVSDVTSVHDVILRRPLELRDLEMVRDWAEGPYLEEITRSGFPAGFGYLDLRDVEPGCDEGGAQVTFYLRKMSLRVAVLENIMSGSILLGDFTYRQTDGNSLRTREEVLLAMGRAESRRAPLFSLQVLKPGEKVVVPVELVLSRKNEALSLPRPLQGAARDSAVRVVRNAGGITFHYGREASSTFRLSPEDFEKILANGPGNFDLQSEYLYGPTVALESVVVNQVPREIRSFSVANLVVQSGTEGASCPCLYSRDNGQQWLREGVILAGRNSPVRVGHGERVLRRFDGKLMLREEEPETSYIDRIVVEAVVSDDDRRILEPLDPRLKAVDGQEVVLKLGEEIEIVFREPIPEAKAYVVRAFGYYVPEKKEK